MPPNRHHAINMKKSIGIASAIITLSLSRTFAGAGCNLTYPCQFVCPCPGGVELYDCYPTEGYDPSAPNIPGIKGYQSASGECGTFGVYRNPCIPKKYKDCPE